MSDSKTSGVSRDDHAATRYFVYGLLAVISVAGMTSRIAVVRSKSGQTPMLSANDRSRWANIRSLVDQGTYHIDHVVLLPTGKRNPEWYSIDMVKHRGTDGREHYYSSKPTLLNTLLAGPYWVLKQTTGITLVAKPHFVIRLLLVLFNVFPLMVYFQLVAWMVERWGTTDFGRIFTMAAATFGTFLTTFAVTVNNHLPAAICLLATVVVLLHIAGNNRCRSLWFALAGFLAALTASNELPALSFFCLVALVLLKLSWRKTCAAFVPAAGLVAAAAIGTNFVAHGTWSTPYAHRRDGNLVNKIPAAESIVLRAGTVAEPLRTPLRNAGIVVSAEARLDERPNGQGWVLWDPESHQRWAIRPELDGIAIRTWDNWYEYEGSYWSSGKKQGVDRGESSQATYAVHALVGHHGVFSLTPLWIVSIIGAGFWVRSGTLAQRAVALGTLLLTVVCLTFFIFLRPLEDRNYGGVSCCFRWSLWLIPLWLLCLLPAVDAMASCRWLRRLAGTLLFVSTFSATYNSLNPWSHPWLFDYWSYLGWIRY